MNKRRKEILSAFCIADLDDLVTYDSLVDSLEAADMDYIVRDREEAELRWRTRKNK